MSPSVGLWDSLLAVDCPEPHGLNLTKQNKQLRFMVLEWLLPVEQETSGEAQTSQTLTLYGPGMTSIPRGSIVVPFWELPCRILNMNRKKELLWSL